MSGQFKTLRIRFDGTVTNREEFLRRIRVAVTEMTGEMMTLDVLINEIAKNIFDHAHGFGFLLIEDKEGSFEFEIKDDGQEAYDFEQCSVHSKLVGNGVNFGIGLRTIRDFAESLNIDLKINCSSGFSYSGIYVPQKHIE